ncbi:hypothetical protein C7446_0268 [Kushneria sinocarnis]|uniref:DUF484 family protein n=1 Tax=Kushneria sinocarnis TaxID=595502 RepID=A0A420X0S2_9GAMM|nr:DUF484 family protein [Kushneria sinocarnis]RKR07456.1 hypothetical protein C7446_0268 [Kushneria sinocarnis]
MSDEAEFESLDAAQVAHWLTAHPDFFMGREALLEQLRLPHPHAPGTVSLIERQVLALRHRCERNEQRLTHLQRDHQQLQRRERDWHALMLALLEADGLDALAQTLAIQLGERFAIDAIALWLPATITAPLHPPLYPLDDMRRDQLESALARHDDAPVQLSEAAWHLWLPDARRSGQGGAALPVRLALGEHYGYLIIADADPERLRRGPLRQLTGHLGEIMTRLLPRRSA